MRASHVSLVSRFAFVLAMTSAFATVFAAPAVDARSRREARSQDPESEMLALLRGIKKEVRACNEQLAEFRGEMDEVRSEVTTLGQDLRPCTPDRFVAESCGVGQHPFNLVVTLCGNVGAEANVSGAFAVENHNSIELGVGWDEGVHANLDRQLQFPGIPGAGLLAPPGSILFGVPLPDLSAGAGGYGGVEVSGCIEGVSIPIGPEMPRAQVLALIEQLEQGARALQNSMVRSLEQRSLTPERIAGAIDAVESFQENRLSPGELGMKDPMEIFQTGPLREVANALPVGGRMQALLDDPTQFITTFDVGVTGTIASVGQLCEQDLADRPTVEIALVPICDMLDRTPSFERLTASLELIGELPEEIKAAIADLLPDVDVNEIPPPRTGDVQRRVCNVLPFLPRCR